MKRIDAVILAALLVAIAGSVLGVMTYEDSRGSSFRVTWETREEVLEADPQSMTGDGQVELTLPVLFANVTGGNVSVDVASSPGALAPIAVRIEVRVPGIEEPFVTEGELPTASAGTTFTVPVRLAGLPNATTLRAASPEAARAQLADEHRSALGEGNWTIAVTLAATAPDPLGAVQHTIAATASLQVYEPEIVPLLPEVQR